MLAGKSRRFKGTYIRFVIFRQEPACRHRSRETGKIKGGKSKGSGKIKAVRLGFQFMRAGHHAFGPSNEVDFRGRGAQTKQIIASQLVATLYQSVPQRRSLSAISTTPSDRQRRSTTAFPRW